MQNKRRKNLHKYLMQTASADEVISNHAYGRVARGHRPIPKRRPHTKNGKGIVAGYGDSMVGSMVQYREKIPAPESPSSTPETPAPDTPVVGNRPAGGEKPQVGASPDDRRHHFIEPPKRGFNRFG